MGRKRATIADLEKRAAALKGWAKRHHQAGRIEKAKAAVEEEAKARATVASRRLSSLRQQMKRADRLGLSEEATVRRREIGRRIRRQRDELLTWKRSEERAAGRQLPPLAGHVHAGTHAETRYVGSARSLLGLLEARPTVDVLQVVPFGDGQRRRGRLPRGTKAVLDELGLEGEERKRAEEALRIVAGSEGGAQVTLEVGVSEEKPPDPKDPGEEVLTLADELGTEDTEEQEAILAAREGER